MPRRFIGILPYAQLRFLELYFGDTLIIHYTGVSNFLAESVYSFFTLLQMEQLSLISLEIRCHKSDASGKNPYA